jgi:hypothetical protein
MSRAGKTKPSNDLRCNERWVGCPLSATTPSRNITSPQWPRFQPGAARLITLHLLSAIDATVIPELGSKGVNWCSYVAATPPKLPPFRTGTTTAGSDHQITTGPGPTDPGEKFHVNEPPAELVASALAAISSCEADAPTSHCGDRPASESVHGAFNSAATGLDNPS